MRAIAKHQCRSCNGSGAAGVVADAADAAAVAAVALYVSSRAVPLHIACRKLEVSRA